MMRIGLCGGEVFDGETLQAGRSSILVADGKIEAIADGHCSFADAVNIDVTGCTVMPGLIDAHIHFAMWGMDLLGRQADRLSLLCCETANELGKALARGCTTARDLGGLDAGFRDAVARGLVAGPDLHTSVLFLTPTAGVLDRTTRQGLVSPTFPGTPNPVCDGPDQVRQRVREAARAGADVIKIGATGAASSLECSAWLPTFSATEIEAAVGQAHALGLPVACHAVAGPGVRTAIEAGVDSLEHGAELTEDLADAIAAKGIFYVPTLAAYRLHFRNAPAWKLGRAKRLEESHRLSFDLARQAGAVMVMGSDCGGPYGYDFTLELEMLVDFGLSAAEALKAATTSAARCLRIGDRTGFLGQGLKADLLVVDGRPAQDVAVLRDPANLALVMKGGVPVSGRIAGSIAGAAR